MLNFNSLLLFSQHPDTLAKFYQQVVDKSPDWDGDGFVGFKIGSGYLTIGPHDKVKGKSKQPERIMFNLETDDVKGEFKRLKKLGAKVIAEPYNPGQGEDSGLIATLADPDGNYFQLVSPMDMDDTMAN
jgi:predicted enzyme related to lactoylglutathione lyase